MGYDLSLLTQTPPTSDTVGLIFWINLQARLTNHFQDLHVSEMPFLWGHPFLQELHRSRDIYIL